MEHEGKENVEGQRGRVRVPKFLGTSRARACGVMQRVAEALRQGKGPDASLAGRQKMKHLFVRCLASTSLSPPSLRLGRAPPSLAFIPTSPRRFLLSHSAHMPANPAEIPRERDTDVFGVLERYACTPNPETLSPAVHHAHDAKTVTIYDAYPKSKYHLLVLPRPREGVITVPDLLNLRTLLNGDKERAKRVLDEMGVAAEAAKKDVREEMQRQWGFQWDVWIGFHALPSMRSVPLTSVSGRALRHTPPGTCTYTSCPPISACPP